MSEADPSQQLSEGQRTAWWRVRPSTLIGLRMVWDASPRLNTVLLPSCVVLGLMPTAAVLASSQLVRQALAATRHGRLEGHDEHTLLALLSLITAIFLVQEVGSAIYNGYVRELSTRADALRRLRVMRASLRPARVEHLEDAEILDLIHQGALAQWPNPGDFAAGVYGVLRTRILALASAVLVSSFEWWLGVGLLILWLWAGRELRLKQAESWADSLRTLRSATYLRELGLSPKAGKEIRIFGFAEWLVDSYSHAWFAVMRTVWRRRGAPRRAQTRLMFILVTAHLFALAVVVQAAHAGRLTIPHLMIVVPAMLGMSELAQMNPDTYSVTLGTMMLPSMIDLEERVAQLTSTSGDPVGGLPAREVAFEHVSFSYPGNDRVIYADLNLRINVGQSLAIVGVNGVGKTTLAKLLAGLYLPTSGRISVDGRDLRELDQVAWQRRVAAIFQDFVHFPLSAADNVGFGHHELAADVGALDRAARQVDLAEFIERLPNGWQTVLDRRYPGGVDLSGGQWQRLALARAAFALNAGAGILILDEPTANLDVRSEIELFDRFLDMTQGATTVLISHRFSTVRRANRIVVLDGGRVAEDGSHDELMALGGRYAAAFRLQAERYLSGSDEALVVGGD